MGTVWLAKDELLGRFVAVKEVQFAVSLPEQERSSARARVMREAHAAARIEHPAAVRIFDVCEGDTEAFIVMEFVDARSLAEAVERDGPIDPSTAATIGLQVLGALEVAHAGGIVHRDVKPANVLLSPHGGAKLADFGIASIQGAARLTATGTLLGSPPFMAPEQALGNPASPATDLWGLGATLFFALEGRPPFNEGSSLATLRAVVSAPPRPMSRCGSLAPVIAGLLAKDPHDRPRSKDLRVAIQSIAAGTAAGAPSPWLTEPARASSPTSSGADPLPVASTASSEPRSRSSRMRTWHLAAVLSVVAIVGAAVTLGSGDRDTPAPDGEGKAAQQGRAERERPDAAGVPSGWTRHRAREVNYSLAHPPGWHVVRVTDTITDFRDPAGGTYLRVDWTNEPGPSPEAAWEELSARLARSKAAYREIGITPTTYKGFDAAILEFTYSEGGADLHAVDLGFVTGQYGFALNFQTRAQDWEASRDVFEDLKAGFRVPR